MREMEIRAEHDGESAAAARANSEHSAAADRRGIDRRFLDYYGLMEQPFGVTPDLRFLYLGVKHRQALDVLNYGTELNRGFLTLIAWPGMGKTSLLFHYLEGLRAKARTVFLFQTDCDSTELMRYLLADLGLDGTGKDLPEMRAILNQVLLAEMEAGRSFVLVIDEAQNLDEKVLESIRLLSNFETPWMKLAQIVLAGQPQFAEMLARPSMVQLRQRVSLAVRIEPFTREEVGLYMDHRLRVAGYQGAPLFSAGARKLISEQSQGIPRIINNMCFCGMSYAWAMKLRTVDRDTMMDVLATSIPESRNENTAVPRSSPGQSECTGPGRSQARRPVGQTMKTPPWRGWRSKIGIAGAALIAAVWLGFQPNVGKWPGLSVQAVSNALRAVVPPPLLSLKPASATGLDTAANRTKATGSVEK